MSEVDDINFFELARTIPQEEFVQRCPWYFIMSRMLLTRPTSARPTMVPGALTKPASSEIRIHQQDIPYRPGIINRAGKEEAPLVLAVRKVHSVFPSMITVGRTSNNDVVVPDITISKFHAYFRMHGTDVDLTDAGSRNGTFVGDTRLIPNGEAARLAPGMVVRFGPRSFDFVTAAACWERVHNTPQMVSS